MPTSAARMLEVGVGLGTMLARLLDWGVVGAGWRGEDLGER